MKGILPILADIEEGPMITLGQLEAAPRHAGCASSAEKERC
jgi:hypothetical protein